MIKNIVVCPIKPAAADVQWKYDILFNFITFHLETPWTDGNSFCVDVVLDSVYMANRDEYSILDQKYEW